MADFCLLKTTRLTVLTIAKDDCWPQPPGGGLGLEPGHTRLLHMKGLLSATDVHACASYMGEQRAYVETCIKVYNLTVGSPGEVWKF